MFYACPHNELPVVHMSEASNDWEMPRGSCWMKLRAGAKIARPLRFGPMSHVTQDGSCVGCRAVRQARLHLGEWRRNKWLDRVQAWNKKNTCLNLRPAQSQTGWRSRWKPTRWQWARKALGDWSLNFRQCESNIIRLWRIDEPVVLTGTRAFWLFLVD